MERINLGDLAEIAKLENDRTSKRRYTADIAAMEYEASRHRVPPKFRKWQVRNLVQELRLELGLSHAAVNYFCWLVDITKERDWQEGKPVVSAKRATASAKNGGADPSTIYRWEKRLEAAGLLFHVDSANFKRSFRRDGDDKNGELVYATGVNLMPAAVRLEELKAMAAKKRSANQTRNDEHAQSKFLRRRVRDQITIAVEAGLQGIEDIVEEADRFISGMRITTRTALEKIVEINEILAGFLQRLLDAAFSTKNERENARQGLQKCTTQGVQGDSRLEESCTDDGATLARRGHHDRRSRGGDERQGGNGNEGHPLPDRDAVGANRQGRVEDDGRERKPTITIGGVSFRDILNRLDCDTRSCWPRHGIDDRGMLDAGERIRRHIKIKTEVWGEAVRAFGPQAAAILVSVIANRHRYRDDHPDRIKNPGGYLVKCTRLHLAGKFNLEDTLIGMVKQGERA